METPAGYSNGLDRLSAGLAQTEARSQKNKEEKKMRKEVSNFSVVVPSYNPFTDNAILNDYEGVPDTWQAVPGKIRGEDGENEEELAFSSSFLATHPKGVTMSGVDFKVVYIAPGAYVLCTAPGDTVLQVLSLAQGEVNVKMCGKEFGVQTGGMWRPRGREQCEVKNVGVEVVIIHVTSI